MWKTRWAPQRLDWLLWGTSSGCTGCSASFSSACHWKSLWARHQLLGCKTRPSAQKLGVEMLHMNKTKFCCKSSHRCLLPFELLKWGERMEEIYEWDWLTGEIWFYPHGELRFDSVCFPEEFYPDILQRRCKIPKLMNCTFCSLI